MTVDPWAWGVLAGRPAPFHRQCFYFSELDIHFFLARRIETAPFAKVEEQS